MSTKKSNKYTKERRQESETSENDFSENDQLTKRNADEIFNQRKKEVLQKQIPSSKADIPGLKKPSNFVVRTIYTLLMLFGFFALVAAGPIYVVGLILFVSALMFNELLRLKQIKEKEQAIPYFFFMNWYFFSASLYFVIGKLIQSKLPYLIFQNQDINFLMKYHNVICFMLWSIGFVIFTLSLKPGFYKYQLRQFGWTHMGCFFIIGAIGFMLQNLYEGLIWFILPATLVISNDIFAYIFGFFFGTHKLIKLSPKKTWEGFIGGAACSFIWAFLVTSAAYYVPALICPQRSLDFIPFSSKSCVYPEYFEKSAYPTPEFLHVIGFTNIWVSDFNLHSMVMSLFASLIAPFGGFFASGLKRALKIKDFGDVIPGHGGLIDRFDCQLIMGMFAYVYLHSIIISPKTAMGTLTSYIDQLNTDDQLTIFNHLKQALIQRNVLEN